jgi:ketosteroid isomerase-like protein
MVRFPGAFRWEAALGFRFLSPRSRLRRTLLSRALVSGWAASSRGDFQLMLVRYAPDVEITWDPGFEALGVTGPFHGHDGVLEMIRRIEEAWVGWVLKPAAVVDLGDRVLALGTMRLPGRVSGLELESEIAQLAVPRGGHIVQQRDFLSWDDGLRAAGFDP